MCLPIRIRTSNQRYVIFENYQIWRTIFYFLFIVQVEHPLFTEMIDLALAILPADGGPPHIKLLLEWSEPEKYFSDLTDPFVEHESVSQMKVWIGDSNGFINF